MLRNFLYYGLVFGLILTPKSVSAEFSMQAGTVVTGILGMELVYIPPTGAEGFLMGSPETERGREADEGPVTKVVLTEGFYLGRYEVTQKIWTTVMKKPAALNCSYGNEYGKSENHPVYCVSWNEVQEFLSALNDMEPSKGIWTLPTESEWEYAARAGTTTAYSFGEDELPRDHYIWYDYNSEASTQPVGLKRPNPWGLHDMHGNVMEWVLDWYDELPGGQVVDWGGAISGRDRVVKGGSYFSGYFHSRSAFRFLALPDQRFRYIGFRLLKTLR